jgi:DNA-nicking Smr family endonuclease
VKKPPPGPFDALKELKKKLEDKPAPKPPPRPKPPGKTDPKDDELAFYRLVTGVTPLDRGPARVPVSERTPLAEPPRKRATAADATETEAVRDHLRSLVEGPPRFEVEDDGRRVEGRRMDLPTELLRKLRRGMMPLDATLDLHGLSVADARLRVEGFLREKRGRGERCVLVIHGKGENSPSGVGVLRGEMAAWLSQGRASEHVAAFSTSLPRDGGEGAVYVLLRRMR